MANGWLEIRQVANRLGVSGSTIRRWCIAGRFPKARKFGSGSNAPWMVPESDLDGFEKPKRGRPPKK